MSEALNDGKNTVKPPRDCHWCGAALSEGEVFVFETEVVAIVTDEPFLVEHRAVSGNAGLHASCNQCRQSMIRDDDAQEIEEANTEEWSNRTVTLIWRGFTLLIVLSFLAPVVLKESVGLFYVVVGALVAAVPLGFVWLVVNAIVRQSGSDPEDR